MLGDHVFIGQFNFLDATAGLTIDEGVQISNFVSIVTHSSHRSIRLLGASYVTHPQPLPGYRSGSIHIGAYSYVAFGATILSHDATRSWRAQTRVGENCFIGARSLIMPGVTIGDHCIVGAGSVVTKDVPSGCIVAGNPAKILRDGQVLSRYGILPREQWKTS